VPTGQRAHPQGSPWLVGHRPVTHRKIPVSGRIEFERSTDPLGREIAGSRARGAPLKLCLGGSVRRRPQIEPIFSKKPFDLTPIALVSPPIAAVSSHPQRIFTAKTGLSVSSGRPPVERADSLTRKMAPIFRRKTPDFPPIAPIPPTIAAVSSHPQHISTAQTVSPPGYPYSLFPIPSSPTRRPADSLTR
jgi:hypothetical protein